MSRKIKVGIVDTGIHAEHPYLKDKIVGIYEYCAEQKDIYAVPKTTCNDQNGHGTACASVIVKECPMVELYVYKLLDRQGEANLLALENTLYTLLNTELDIINLSLSIEKQKRSHELKYLCKELEKQGKLVIVALKNHEYKSYPSAYRFCYGVRGSILDNRDDFWFSKYRQIQCIVDSTPFLHCDTTCGYHMFGKSNSYAAAKMTGKIARILAEGGKCDMRQMNKILSENAKRNFWHSSELRTSRRFPDLKQYENVVDNTLVTSIEEIVKAYLRVDIKNLREHFLFGQDIGLKYELCYSLLKELELRFGFQVYDYTKISREDFYTIGHLSYLIQRQMQAE